ncbi:MAG TPA: hypothetical protein VHA70_07040 [Bauldia sp.]|nr:hypothetical protein [Bauldia sp.]
MTVASDVSAGDAQVVAWYGRARPICLARLMESRDGTTALFSRQLREGEWDRTRGTEAATSTAIGLIALSRIGGSFLSPEETERSLRALAAEVRMTGYRGALGVGLWANAVAGANDFGGFLRDCGVAEGDLRGLMRGANSMELAWLLSGLLHEQLRAPTPALNDLCREARGILHARQRPTGLFMHAGREGKFTQRIRRRVATFADQIYSMLALAHSAIVFGKDVALDSACRCADALLARRGPLHQWWWHYEPDRGAVLRHYPVYAVHQYGMAPIAFLTLAAGGARAYRRLAWPGLEWIGTNEIGGDLFDPIAGTVWRDVHVKRSRIGGLLRNAGEIAGLTADAGAVTGLALNRETRPYEWAWCLMAEALLASPPPGRHLA